MKKSTNKPPKAPKAQHQWLQQNLNSKFENEIDLVAEENEEAVPNEKTIIKGKAKIHSQIKSSFDSCHNSSKAKEKNLNVFKKKKSGGTQEIKLKSKADINNKYYRHQKENTNDKDSDLKPDPNDRRHTAKVMIPIVLGSISGVDSEDSNHESDEWPFDALQVLNINSLDDFLQEFWLKIESELHSDLQLKSTNNNKIYNFNKSIFNQFWQRWNKVEVKIDKEDNNADKKNNDILKGMDLWIDDLRVGDDIVSENKIPSARNDNSANLQEQKKEPTNAPAPKLNFEDVFKNLDKMSNSDVLFQGINDEVYSPYNFMNNLNINGTNRE